MCAYEAIRRQQADSDWRSCLRAIRIMRTRMRSTDDPAVVADSGREITYLRLRAWSSRGLARAELRQ